MNDANAPDMADAGLDAVSDEPPRRVLFATFEARRDIDDAKTLLRRLGFEAATLAESGGNVPPNALIVEIDAEQGMRPEAETLVDYFNDSISAIIGVSTDSSIGARLAAVRAGCDSFLPLPLDPARLLDEIDRLTSVGDEPPPRVMIVDDEEPSAAYVEAILKAAGMITDTVNEPLKVLQRAEAFAPELILMDLYMPHCSGIELAAVIRQQEAYAGIPIVFLSGEHNMETQLGALGHGGDDFLTKPIKPQHLISAVHTRIERFRALRERMVRDSLTGLYNHTTTQQFLANEMARAKRRGTPLSFAMIDLDHFKQVNDTHGHAVGDVVIKSLSRLLRQRLRGADVIGRMGGEEFAAILAEADGGDAKRVMDGIREDFAGIRHVADGAEFHTTFSCGIAVAADYPEPQALADAADRALYEAKGRGRNQVVLASAAP